MSQRKKRVLLAAYVTFAFLVTAGFALQETVSAGDYRRYRQYGYEQALADLAASVDDMEVSLSKSLCAASPQLFTACCADVYAKALTAQAALGQLPSGGEGLESTAAFLSRAGAYSLSLAKTSAGGSSPTESDYENLAALKDAASSLTQSLAELYYAVRSGDVSVERLEENDTEAADLEHSLRDLEEEFPSLPTLIYDGPFSQEEHEGTPRQLAGLDILSEEEARKAAADFTGLEALDYTGKRDAELPVYVFQTEDGDSSYIVEVTQQGGSVLSFRSTAASSAENLSTQEASGAAQAFLSDHGFDGFSESYHEIQAGHCVICFVCEEDGVLMYPDLVKVAVNLETGEISGYDAEGYLMNHGDRLLPERVITEDDAMDMVSPWLTPEAVTPCVIPIGDNREAYCLEVLCTGGDGRHYLVYVNALSGEEEKILILLEDESGTLTR